MRCPTCKKSVDASPANSFRPFCSERCRMVDLGTWAAEDYRVAGGKAEDDSEHPDDRRKPGDRRKEDLLKKPNLN
ncbi:MAG TPA: DNA gyrase inhibitor YacG [Candidatus Binataceae bacterium]|nr:DNA gyrase inhibitor YacG [Candidatus Binataceae bacterium]